MYPTQSAEFGPKVPSYELGGLKQQGNQEDVTRPVSNCRFTYQGYRGNRILTAEVDVFGGELFDRNSERLKSTATKLHATVFGIEYKQASFEVNFDTQDRGTMMYLVRPLKQKLVEESGLEKVWNMSGKLASSVIERFRSSSRPMEDELIDGCLGYAVAQVWKMPWQKRMLRVLYISSVVILDGYRQMGLGAKIIQISNALSQPHMIAARIQTGAMWSSMIKSHVVDKASASPFEKLYSQDSRKQKALKLLAERTWHPNTVDLATGITQALYPEGQNQTYVSEPRYEEAYYADTKMKALGLESSRGDGMYTCVDAIDPLEFIEV